jgi:hypothetical protein
MAQPVQKHVKCAQSTALRTRFFKHSPTVLVSINITFIIAANVAPHAT